MQCAHCSFPMKFYSGAKLVIMLDVITILLYRGYSLSLSLSLSLWFLCLVSAPSQNGHWPSRQLTGVTAPTTGNLNFQAWVLHLIVSVPEKSAVVTQPIFLGLLVMNCEGSVFVFQKNSALDFILPLWLDCYLSIVRINLHKSASWELLYPLSLSRVFSST